MSDQLQIFGSPHLAHDSRALPSVTLALFAYNQQSYVRAAVEGALGQVYNGPLEIILSDDGSPDATFAVMEEVVRAYNGPHHVRLIRNEKNLGLSAHVNHVLAMAKGKIIVMAAGDDISLSSRVQDTVAAFARYPEVMAVSFEDICIDENGVPCGEKASLMHERTIDLDVFLSAGPRAQSRLRLSAASRAFRRIVYDQFGNLLPDCPAEDSPYLFRSLYLGLLVVLPKPGIRYRVHSSQMSSTASIAKMDCSRLIAQYRQDLESALAKNPDLSSKLPAIQAFFSEKQTYFLIQKLIREKLVPDKLTVYRALVSRSYTIREKLGLCKRFLFRQVVA